MKALSINELSYNYGGKAALCDVSLEVNLGIIHGIVGPDSAGKTTLLRIISSLLPVTACHLEVMGLSLPQMQNQLRRRIGYMPQRFSLYQDLSVQQNLLFFARLFGVNQSDFRTRVAELYGFSRLEPFKKRKAGHLSGGMKQKLALSCALIHTPELIVLDEPTFGVDPLSRRDFWQILHHLRDQGISIIVSTAYMDEAELCDDVSLLWEGKIMQTGKPSALLKAWPLKLYRLIGTNSRHIAQFMTRQAAVHNAELFGSEVHISCNEELSPETFKMWQQNCPNLQTWERIDPRMEDVFLSLMNDDSNN